MDVTFERGDPQRPKGHALAYFRTQLEPDVVYATYIIVLPVSVDFTKYVPPFLASHVGNVPLSELSAFSLPPVPEAIASHQELHHLAEIRDDDLLYAGSMYSFDLPAMMQAASDAVQYYAELWSDRMKPTTALEASTEDDHSSVNEVLYSLMNQPDRLAELSKLVSSLRFAVEGNDTHTGAEMEEEIKLLGRHLPEHYYIASLLLAVRDSSARGAQLAKLYLDRCYRLSNRDEVAAKELEDRIEALKSSE